MGRGRNKAKQQKVARELKYMQHSPDFAALSRELAVENSDRNDEPDRNDDDEE